MKTTEELNALKEEVKNLNEKLSTLTEEEVEQVTGGLIPPYPPIGSFEDEISYHVSPRGNNEPGIDASIQQIDDGALLPFN